MDPQTVIYGRSDDLINVEGIVCGELYAEYNEPTYVRVDSFVFKVKYDTDGIWRIEIEKQPKDVGCQHYNVGDLDEFRDYTEVVKFNCSNGARVEKVDGPSFTPPSEKAADEVRDELMDPMQSSEYNQGVDDAIERMEERWENHR